MKLFDKFSSCDVIHVDWLEPDTANVISDASL